MTEPINILCVMKSGGGYNLKHVDRLADMVKENIGDTPYTFNCLTDLVRKESIIDNIQFIPLEYGWPGWWSKVEMFDPGLFEGERILYIDLDVLITGSLKDIASYKGDACICRGFSDHYPTQSIVNFKSGYFKKIWKTFNEDPKKWIKDGNLRMAPHFGDRVLFTKLVYPKVDFFQDLYPGQVVSFRHHCRDGLPSDARVVQFHGNPKPWDVKGNKPSQEWIVKLRERYGEG